METGTSEDAATVSMVDDVVVVRLVRERLDIEHAASVRELLHEQVKAGHQHLVVDVEAVTFIDSSGLGALISALKMVRTSRDRRQMPRPEPVRRPSSRGDLKLANVQPPVLSLLEIIRLDRVFKRHPSVEAAVASFGKGRTS